MSRDRSSSRRFYRGESYSNLLACMDKGLAAEEENRWTFEIAWEVANKGIETVSIPPLIEKIIFELQLISNWIGLQFKLLQFGNNSSKWIIYSFSS